VTRGLARIVFLVIGWLNVLLGVVGIFTPILPTTPFLLLAFWCFSKSSPKFARWLEDHPWFGPPIRDWQRNRAISMKAKCLAISMMTGSCVLLFFLPVRPYVRWVLIGTMALVGVFIATRKTARPRSIPHSSGDVSP